MGDRLKNKVAIVTGAGRGIGAAIARSFGREGAAIVLAELDAASGAQLESELIADGFTALSFPTDVTQCQQVKEMVNATVRQFGPPDILVNNAGINVFRDPLTLTDEEWRRCFLVDLDATWICSRAALPLMIENGRGAIINIGSCHSHRIIRGCFPYPVAKHGLIGLTRALAIEYAAHNIRVNAILPGFVETALSIEYWNTFPDPTAERDRVYNLHPPKRIGTPEEVAMTAVFLASDEAPFINAASIPIDGGRSVMYLD